MSWLLLRRCELKWLGRLLKQADAAERPDDPRHNNASLYTLGIIISHFVLHLRDLSTNRRCSRSLRSAI